MSATGRTLSTFALGTPPPTSCRSTEQANQDTDRSPLLGGTTGLLFASPSLSSPPPLHPQRPALTSPISTFGSSVVTLPRAPPVRYTPSRNRGALSPPPPVFTMSSSPPSQENRDVGANQGSQPLSSQSPRQRGGPLNSVYWLGVELVVTLAQIISSIVVLSVSTSEHPKVPLGLWIIGYATGCFATLPILHWRYTHRRGRTRQSTSAQTRTRQLQDQEAAPSQSQEATQPSNNTPDSSANSSVARALHFSPSEVGLARTRNRQTASESAPQQGVATAAMPNPPAGDAAIDMPPVQTSRLRRFDDTSWTLFIERLKIALDCFFAVWFVVGNVWLFGGHASAHDAPNMYRLCIVFLTFSCLGYAMPFILCATICLLLPCIAVMGFVDEPMTGRGASKEVITSFPTYKFRALGSMKGKRASRQSSASDSEGEGEKSGRGGILAAGTPLERPVAAEDALCCICLGQYNDGDELRELPCTHHFHSSCVDQWLKINASCPLCKSDMIAGSGSAALETGSRTPPSVNDSNQSQSEASQQQIEEIA